MSPPKTANRDPAEYLASVLLFNPIFQADEILAARDRFLGRSCARSDWELREQYETATSRLESLRYRLWTAGDDELGTELADLVVGEFSDLVIAAERLRAVVQLRLEFSEIARHKHSDHELLNQLKAILAAEARESSRLKQCYLLQAVADSSKQVGRHRMVRLLHRRFPRVYALELEWLESIRQSRPIRPDTPTEAELIERFNNHPIWGWICGLLVLGTVGLPLIWSVWNSRGPAIEQLPVVETPSPSPMNSSERPKLFLDMDASERRKLILDSLRKRFPDNEIWEDGEKVWMHKRAISDPTIPNAATDSDSDESTPRKPDRSQSEPTVSESKPSQ